MGQCSSSMRQLSRTSQPEDGNQPDGNDNRAVSAINRLRRRRSTDGMRHHYKRPRPQEDQPEFEIGEREPGDVITDADIRLRTGTQETEQIAQNDLTPPQTQRVAENADASSSISNVSDLSNRLPTPPQYQESAVNDQFGELSTGLLTPTPAGTPSAPPQNAMSGRVEEPSSASNTSSTLSPYTANSPSGSPAEELEFFDAPNSPLPPVADILAANPRFESRPVASFPLLPPTSRPPPPPIPLIPSAPWGNQTGRRHDDEDEQVTVLSRVLLAAATLTATHLVGEHIGRGELYGGSNQATIMQERAAREVETRNREQAQASGQRPPADPHSTDEGATESSNADPIHPNNNAQESEQQREEPSIAGASRERTSSHSTSRSGDESRNEGTQNSGTDNNSSTRRSLTFPDFLEQLRSGRHSPELSQVMFNSERPTNFFRFFRFPEDREGRIPILLMGIRSAEGNTNAQGDQEQGEDTTEPAPHGRPFEMDAGRGLDFQFDSRNRVNDPTPNSDGLDLFDPQLNEPFRNPFSREARSGENYPRTNDHHYTQRSLDDSIIGGMDEVEEDEDDGDSDDDPIFGGDELDPDRHESQMLMDALLDGIVGNSFPNRSTNESQPENNPRELTIEENQNATRIQAGDPFAASDGHIHGHQRSRSHEDGDNQHPQNEESTENRHRNHHSWVIYVIGGAYPPTHPIFFAPSLLTDNPTYEDMLIVEQLLGPVKPPVASKNDVASAGGISTVQAGSPLLTERCPICLTDYAEDDICRELGCKHLFHQECVDSWLTRSHNSCPMCRHEGVPSKEPSNPNQHSQPDVAAT